MGQFNNGVLCNNENDLSGPWQKIYVIMATSDKIRNYIHDVIKYLKDHIYGEKRPKRFEPYLHI